VFLATKTGERRGDAARAELERSLERMGVDQVDLVQLHNLVEPEEWEVAHGPGGAVAALDQAREEGLTRFVGVTGHGLRIARMHLRSLERYPFHAVLLPYSHVLLQDPSYRHDVEVLLERCGEEEVAVQTIKAIARRRWAPDTEGPRFSWYEPLSDPDAVSRAIRYVLADPQLFLNTTSDARLLPLVLDAAAGPLDRPAEAELLADAEACGINPLFDGGALERI
jgi:predicted aldo/keto reductase-like oxidoreductase